VSTVRTATAAKKAALTPKGLKASAVTAGSILLRWKSVPGARGYVVLRDGKVIGTTAATHLNDKKVKPGQRYRYQVRARDRKKAWLGPACKAIRVTAAPAKKKVAAPVAAPAKPIAAAVPAAAAPSGGGGDAPSGGGGPDPGDDGGTDDGGDDTPTGTVMTRAMVERMFWRAGFGASEAERTAWTGKTVEQLVDFFLGTPQTLTPTSTPPVDGSNQPIDPLASDNDLVMEWLDTMQRAQNPFIERLTLFWHRHWAISRADGVPAEWALTYRDRLRRFSDLATNPDASFRQLALEMTTVDGAMSLFLTMWANQKGQVNENYAREFMELFCLGVFDAQGNPNYTQADVGQLAKAFTGWRLNQSPGTPGYGTVAFGGSSFFDATAKTILGQTGTFGAAQAVDIVLSQPAHAPFLVRKLWGEFVSQPLPQATLDSLVATYTAGGALKIKPLLRGILTHPLLLSSLDEPDMIKPPIVYAVGVLKALGVPMKDYVVRQELTRMQQVPYYPPNVAGWEGGVAWMNTNTAQSRFDYVLFCFYMKYKWYPGASSLADVPGESATQAFDRAYALAGSPWLSGASRTQLQSMASSMAASSAALRRQRVYALLAYMLGGPDAQVM